jgi:hypothetical protein
LIVMAGGFLLVDGLGGIPGGMPVLPPAMGVDSALTPLCTLLGLACALLPGPISPRRLHGGVSTHAGAPPC